MNSITGESLREDYENLSTKIIPFPKSKNPQSNEIVMLEKKVILNHDGSDRIVPVVQMSPDSEYGRSSHSSQFELESLKSVKIHFYRNNGDGRKIFKNEIDILHNPLSSLFLSFAFVFPTTYIAFENGLSTGFNSAIIAASGAAAFLGGVFGILKQDKNREDFIENIFEISEKDFLESINNNVFREIYETQLNGYEKLKLYYQFVRLFCESLDVSYIDDSIEKRAHKKLIRVKDIDTDVSWIRNEFLKEASRKFKKTYSREENVNFCNKQGFIPGYEFKKRLGTYDPINNPIEEDSVRFFKVNKDFENSINFEKVFERI